MWRLYIVGGMITSTIYVLILVPVFFALIRSGRYAGADCGHRNSDPYSSASGAIIAGFALQSFDAFFPDDGNHDAGRCWVGPPETEKGVEE
jgi:hypothetical protein